MSCVIYYIHLTFDKVNVMLLLRNQNSDQIKLIFFFVYLRLSQKDSCIVSVDMLLKLL